MSICKQKSSSFAGSFLFRVKYLDTDLDVPESRKVSLREKVLGGRRILGYNGDNQN